MFTRNALEGIYTNGCYTLDIENTGLAFFDIKFTGQGFENAC